MSDSAASSPLAPFGFPTFRNFWFGSILSNLGGLIQGVGAAWLMTSLTPAADMVALIQASAALPIMLFSLPAGAIADGFDRRSVMLMAQIFMLLVSATLAVCAWYQIMTPWLLLSFTFLLGCGISFNIPAWQASVGDIVPRSQVGAAVLLNSVGFNATRSLGPAVGGALVAATGAFAAFAVNTVSYLGLILALLLWRPPERAPGLPREPLSSAVWTGVRYVAMSPNLGRVLLRGFVFGLTTIVILALLPVVARDSLNGSALLYGILLGAFGVGAVGGAFGSAPLRARLSNEVLVRWMFVAMAIAAALIGVSRTPLLTVLALALGGAAWVLTLSLFNTTIQMSTPRWVVGRALSLYQMATFGGMALGSWFWGTIAEQHSPTIALVVAAGTALLGAVVGWLLPLPAEALLDLDPLNRWREPEVELDLRPRSGPVAIAVEYRIADEHLDAFMRLMEQRRRVRRRDGAQRWSLLRDMEQPAAWIERFELPTWVEYVRFHERTTQADAPISDGLRALHSGDWPPRVRRLLVRDLSQLRSDELERSPVDPL